MDPITELLRRSREGDREALEELSNSVYSHLHRIAEGYLRTERSEHTLTATALVNEAWIRLAAAAQPDFQDRSHFFALAAKKMRQILVDYARRRSAGKRGSGKQTPLEEGLTIATLDDTETLLVMNQLLEQMEQANARRARLFELRFFGGLSAEAIGELEQISLPTVQRELRVAQAWLCQQILSKSK